MTDLELYARNLAEAEKEFRAIDEYVKNLPDGDTLDVRIDWRWGAACAGYDETARRVRHQMQAAVRPLILQAREDAWQAVRIAREGMRVALENASA